MKPDVNKFIEDVKSLAKERGINCMITISIIDIEDEVPEKTITFQEFYDAVTSADPLRMKGGVILSDPGYHHKYTTDIIYQGQNTLFRIYDESSSTSISAGMILFHTEFGVIRSVVICDDIKVTFPGSMNIDDPKVFEVANDALKEILVYCANKLTKATK